MVFLEGYNCHTFSITLVFVDFSRETFTGCTIFQSHPGTCRGKLHVPHRGARVMIPPTKARPGIWGVGLRAASINAKGGIIMKLQAVGVVVGYPPIAWNQEPKSHPRRTS